MKSNRIILVFVSIFISNCLFATMKLPAVFSDGMVLQQRSDAIFWGWASPGETITISTGWSKKTHVVKADQSGNWKVSIKTADAGGPFNVLFKGNNSIEIKDVLIGEVWVCSGQTNMGFTLKTSDGAKDEIAQANYPTIRYFSVKRQYGLQEFNDCPGSVWQKTSPATAGSFSAVAYFFAKKIQEELNVPVGIIFNAWGGTPAEAWTPSEVLRSDTILSKYFDRWGFIQQHVGQDSAAYYLAMKQWASDSISIKKPAEPQTLYYFKRPWREPTVLFNGMLNPVIPFAIKGILWYQGESNVSYADEYYHLFSKMIDSWRQRWKSKGYKAVLPFYFVQIAPNGYNDLDAAARLREAQQQVASRIPNTGMAVTTDVGNMNDIHPTRKKEVGDRLAFIALRKTYGRKNIIAEAPVVKSAKIKNGQVILEFNEALQSNSAVGGLEAGYQSASADSIVFTKVNGRTMGSKLILENTRTSTPLIVRYAWILAGDGNLWGMHHLPVAPFRIKVEN